MIKKKEQQEQERLLRPIDIILQQIGYIQNNKVQKIYLLKAGTGAGKSTFFVAELYNTLNGMNMLCTKPRVVLAKIEPAQDLPKYYPHFKPGINMGWQAGGGKQEPLQSENNVMFCTTQVLTNLIQNEDAMKKYKYILIDEVHEMSEQMTGCLFAVKQYLLQHPDNEIIFIMMSATIDIEKYVEYFEMEKKWYNIGFLIPSPMKYHVDHLYISEGRTLQERLQKSYEQINQIYTKNNIATKEFRNILVFTKGGKVMLDLLEFSKRFHFKFPVKAFSYTSQDNRLKTQNFELFQQKEYDFVKLIVTTNLLEAGANIQGLYTCIDTGMQTQQIYNIILRQNQFITTPISLSSQTQRKGRVGREGEGLFIGLYSQNFPFTTNLFNPFLTSQNFISQMFEMLRQSIVIKDSVQDFLNTPQRIIIQKDIDLLDPLNMDIFNFFQYFLIKYGFIDRNGNILFNYFLLNQQKDLNNIIINMGQYYGCDIFEICVFLGILMINPKDVQNRYTFKRYMKNLLSQANNIISYNYKTHDPQQLQILLKATEYFGQIQYYYDLNEYYNPNGYEKLIDTFYFTE